MKIRAIKIDVENQTIYEVNYDGTLEDIYKHIGNGCDTFTCPFQFDNMDTIYCDDESILKAPNIKGGFTMPDWSYPLVGNALILGTDYEGDSVSALTSVESLKSQIKFIDRSEALAHAAKVLGTPPRIISF